MRVAILVLTAAVAGCSTPAAGPRSASATRQLSEQQLVEATKSDALNPWPHYGLARLNEARGDYEKAIFHYGACINRLPARKVTRPTLELGILQQRLGNDHASRNCFGEVLDTFPTDTARFHTNPDFRLAALALAFSLKDLPDAKPRVEALKKRYETEFRGNPKHWGTRPPWMDEPLKKRKAQ